MVGKTTYEDRIWLAEVIVSDWGGVRSNKPETLQRYVLEILNQTLSTTLQGVASYSKILSIVQPDQFAIYDARVAGCLNAIQINAGIHKGLAFNYVSGRNNVVGNKIKKSGFTQDPRLLVTALARYGWFSIKRNQTYTIYLKILSLCLEKLPNDYKLASLEMALFANAERECQQAMDGGNMATL